MSEPDQKRLKIDAGATEDSETPKGLTENDVGITQYVNDSVSGFSGSLKQRYTDFQVNEIAEDGTVIHLTDTGVKPQPKPKEEEAISEEVKQQKAEKKPAPDISTFKAELEKSLGKETLENVVALFHTGTKVESANPFEDKTERTKLHQLVKEAFEGRLETSTTKSSHISFRLKTKTDEAKTPRYGGGKVLKYLRFTVYKENKETMEVAGLISRLLRIKPRDVAFAGTKDRRGITVQKFSIQHMNMTRVSSLNAALRGIKLGGMEYNQEPLRLGDLKGNEFHIVIRNVSPENIDNAKASLDSLKQHGFINYFGLQRFGTFSVSTHTVGKAILGGDYDTAVDALLKPQEITKPESKEAREVWASTKNAAKALELMPKHCVAEYSLLTTLSETPSAINAILRIPRNLKLMYVHSYQSYIWNLAVSERIKMSSEPLVGDLVDAGVIDGFQRAREVTQEEVDEKTVSIYDILIPTPGFDVKYPANLLSFYEGAMGADGIDPHKMRRNIKDFSLPGGYRNLMAKPSNVEFEIARYDDVEEDIITTDSTLLDQGLDPYTVATRLIHPEKTDGKFTAIVLKMSLGTSQYATMALREVMKVDTSRHGGLFFS